MQKIDPATAATIASAVVALVALFVAWWNAHIQRRHSRLSVRPHLDFVYGRTTDGPLALWLVNNGIGPAIVESFQVSVEGHVARETHMFGPWSSAFTLAKAEPPSTTNSPSVGQYLSAGQRLLLVDADPELQRAKTPEVAVQAARTYEDALAQMRISIEYRCLYGERFKSVWQFRSEA